MQFGEIAMCGGGDVKVRSGYVSHSMPRREGNVVYERTSHPSPCRIVVDSSQMISSKLN